MSELYGGTCKSCNGLGEIEIEEIDPVLFRKTKRSILCQSCDQGFDGNADALRQKVDDKYWEDNPLECDYE